MALNKSVSILLSAATATTLASPAVRGWLRYRESYDHPNERSSHTAPTPRGGGLACAVGAAVGALAAAKVARPPSLSWITASGVLGLVGRIDDLVGLPPSPRLGAQAVAGAVVGGRAGGPLGVLFGVLTMPAVVNSFNFMDGINGISGGTAVAWGICTATDRGQAPHVRVQSLLTTGMGLGFLPFNVPRASMFLGDVGSYLIGAGIAASIVESAFAGGGFNTSLAARSLAPMAPYLADTGTTMVQRVLRGESPTEAHREHAYQRLTQETAAAHWKVSLLVASIAVTCGLASRSRRTSITVVPVIGGYLAMPFTARLLCRTQVNDCPTYK
ncbi:hypothetical protein ACTHRK_18485 [Dietzia cercidiphylli]|uniref:hypothetical protein n=1 Tax=Dietzia cercidiphylli TaxID=498199 RepID=UPI003F8002E1